MHIYLFVSEKQGIPLQEVFLPEYTRQVFSVQTIKEARELLSHTRNGFSEKTAIVIHDFDSTSVEAQNALLKTFEEPGQNTAFILTAQSTMGIAETILSRALVHESNKETENEYEKRALEFLNNPSQRMLIASEFKDREEAIAFTRSLSQKAIVSKPEVLHALTNCFNALKGNGNVALQLTHLVVQMQEYDKD